MASKKEPTHVLQDEEQIVAISKRLKRAHDEIVTQMSAVSKAVNTAAFTLLSTSLRECIVDDKNDSKAVQEKLQKLFLSLA
jgi:DNA-binding FrmR family transcriptional regulator